MSQELSNSSKSLKIAIGVGGRFHADRMAEALLKHGHSVALFSSLPRSRFKNLPANLIESILYPELVFRGLRKLSLERLASDFKMVHFGKALERKVSQKTWDVFIGWSSFSKEVFEKRVAKRQILIRDSTHISFQMDILQEEHSSLALPFARDLLAEEREIIEYELADEIYVLSEFAKRTFVEKGVSPSKIKVLRLGVDTTLFSPHQSTVRFPNRPLQVVYFGAVSVRKGVHYLIESSKRFNSKQIQFHVVGNVEKDLRGIVSKNTEVHWYKPMQQKKLAELMRQMDVFVFPTLEDGFGQTLIQAMSSGLIPVFTQQSGAAELVGEEDGISIAARSSDSVEEALNLLLSNPDKMNKYRESAIQTSHNFGWEIYDKQLQKLLCSN